MSAWISLALTTKHVAVSLEKPSDNSPRSVRVQVPAKGSFQRGSVICGTKKGGVTSTPSRVTKLYIIMCSLENAKSRSPGRRRTASWTLVCHQQLRGAGMGIRTVFTPGNIIALQLECAEDVVRSQSKTSASEAVHEFVQIYSDALQRPGCSQYRGPGLSVGDSPLTGSQFCGR
jgi:hypothetical protein